MRIGESRLYVIPISCLLVTLYFCVHAVNGTRGIRRLEQVNAEIVLATEIAKETQQEKESLQRRVRALSTESLDLDQLEESAMRVLNMGRPDDIVILK